MLKHNKLYQSLKKVTGEWHAGHVEWFYTWNYLKFYDDCIFISASIAGDDVEEIDRTFVREAQNIIRGKFKTQGTREIQLLFENVQVNGFINNDGSIIIEGKIAWDIYYPMT